MKKFSKICALSMLMLMGGLANAGAATMSFTGEANSFDWRTIGTRAKTTNSGYFGASTTLQGSPDTLQFRAVSTYGREFCRVKIVEGTSGTCSYPSDMNSSAGTSVRADVISDTFSPGNFPIKGTINFY